MVVAFGVAKGGLGKSWTLALQRSTLGVDFFLLDDGDSIGLWHTTWYVVSSSSYFSYPHNLSKPSSVSIRRTWTGSYPQHSPWFTLIKPCILLTLHFTTFMTFFVCWTIPFFAFYPAPCTYTSTSHLPLHSSPLPNYLTTHAHSLSLLHTPIVPPHLPI